MVSSVLYGLTLSLFSYSSDITEPFLILGYGSPRKNKQTCFLLLSWNRILHTLLTYIHSCQFCTTHTWISVLWKLLCQACCSHHYKMVTAQWSHQICNYTTTAKHASGHKINGVSWHALCARALLHWLGFGPYAINSWKWSPISNHGAQKISKNPNTHCSHFLLWPSSSAPAWSSLCIWSSGLICKNWVSDWTETQHYAFLNKIGYLGSKCMYVHQYGFDLCV